MSTQINTAVVNTIDSFAAQHGLNYGSYASKVAAVKDEVTATVTEQVAQVVESLRGIASDNNLSESLVENALIEAGLVDAPEPEVEEDAEPESLEAKVERVLAATEEQGRTIAALLAAARSKGIHVAV